MAEKFLKQSSGNIVEQEALVESVGVEDAGKIPALDTDGRLSGTVMPVGIGADIAVIPASEALSAGNLVNIWNDTGTVKVRKADATTSGKPVDGFVLEAVDPAADATVYFEGRDNQLDGLIGGTMYFLATVAGQITDTPPSDPGNIVQKVGRAISATELNFEPQDFIVLA